MFTNTMFSSTPQPAHEDLVHAPPQYTPWDMTEVDDTLNVTWSHNCSTTSATVNNCLHFASSVHNAHPSGVTEDYFNSSLPTDQQGPSLMEIMNEVTSFRVAMTLVTWLFPLVVGVGVVGNAVSLWVLLRRGMRRTSACRYLACLAVADTSVLLASALKTWVRVVWGFELLHVSQVSCKLLIFLTHLSLTAAAWLIVAVTLERFLAVWLPLRATEVCSVGRTRVVMAAMLALLALVNSHVFWTAELLPVPPRRSLSSSGMQCASYAYRTLACRVFPWVHLVLYCFLPAVLLASLNSLILYKLFQHRQAITADQDSKSSRSSSNRNNYYSTNGNNYCAHDYQQQQQRLPRNKSLTRLLLQQQQQPQQQPSRAAHRSSQTPQHFHRRLAPMLLGVSFCWLLLTTPQTIYNLAAPRPTDYEEVGWQYLIKTVCFLLMYLNHAINFFLYCLTGQRFRQELRRGLLCKEGERNLRLKKAFHNKWVGNGQAKSSEQEDGAPGEGAVALNLNEDCDLLGQNVHRRHCEYPLMERQRVQSGTDSPSPEPS